jgi:peroxiredoxin
MLLKSLEDLLGMDAPDFSLLGTDNKQHRLSDYADAKLLVVIFLCNHCPYVKAVVPRLNTLAQEFLSKGVSFVAINANDSEQYPDDSFENMLKSDIGFDYLHDETQEVAKAYQAVCTPDIFVFDEERKLRYHGRIDDNWQDENAVTKHELKNALDALLTRSEILDHVPSMGCSIKWKKEDS